MALVGEDKLWAELALIESFAPSVPLSPRAGQRWYDAASRIEYQFDGTGWVVMSEPTIITFVPVLSSNNGAGTPTFGTPDFRYHRRDGWVDWAAVIPIVVNGAGTTGAVTMTLPIATATGSWLVGTGREDVATGNVLQVLGSGTATWIYNFNNTYPGGNGYTFRLAGAYQMVTRYS